MCGVIAGAGRGGYTGGQETRAVSKKTSESRNVFSNVEK
jgi:hypothetical protein